MKDHEQLQAALEFAREFKKLVERTGFTIVSCGCCPPSMDEVGSHSETFNHGEAAGDIICLLGLEEPYDSTETPEQRIAKRAELIKSIEAML